ncbi:ABC transporter substrate-binding protein [Methylobacterium komagatae]
MSKRLRITAGLAVTVLSLAGPLQAQESLVVAGYSGSTETAIREKILPKFEKENGVKVTYVGGNSTDTLAKLLAQRDNQEYDVALIDDGPMSRAVSLGLCAPTPDIDRSKLQPVANVFGDKASGLGIIATGLMYNTKVFKENGWAPPTSWNDLKDPKYKGKIVMPPLNNGYGLLTVVMLARMNGGGEAKVDPGFAAMRDVAPNILAFEPSPAKITELFQTGQALLAVWGSSRVQAFAETGFPVDFAYPKEGAPVVMTAICTVAKKALSPKAEAFMMMMLSPEVQAILADAGGFAPVNKDTVVQRPGMMPVGDKADKLVAADWHVINPVRDAWNKRWTREIER